MSIAEVASKLKCNKTGGNYTTLNEGAKSLGLTKDHMTGQGWNVGTRYRPFYKKRNLKDILVTNSDYLSTSSLKARLIKEGLLKYECAICNIVNWQSSKLSLQMDYINGIRNDNRIENLRLLCPNCHSQTDTFCQKKQSK